MISRIIESSISPLLGGKKAIIIMGARQVGKSTLLQQMLAGKILNGDQTFHPGENRMTMAGQYICMEMIGKMQRLQIGEEHGKTD